MPYAAVNGTELHYRIDGDRHGHAPWLVLSNSLGCDMSMWTPQVAALSKHFRVLRYDTRGHGHSEAPKGPYTIEQLTGDVLGLMDTLKIARANFCGISMGGLTGIGLARASRRPLRARRAVQYGRAHRLAGSLGAARRESALGRHARTRRRGAAALVHGRLHRA
ncbi:pimeloyl-ACP methyl ester carboxylesterase [Paraburkholderia youngii]